MRIDEIIKQCVQSNKDILWATKGNLEAVVYQKSLMFFSEPGLISDIQEALASRSSSDAAGADSLPLLTENKKLNKYFRLIDTFASAKTKKEAFVSERKLLDSGIDAICLETMDGQRRWINKDLAEPFAFSRKYWILDPPGTDAKAADDGVTAAEIENMVFIEEQGKIAGIVMILRI